MAGDDQQTYGFSKSDARALVESIEGKGGKFVVGRVRSSGGSSSASKIAYAGSGITARSGTTAGSGTVTEYLLSGGTLTTNTTTFTAYNLSQHAIPAGSYVLCTQESISNFWIATPPGIINLRLDSGNLQYTYDGTNWTTWETTTTCT